MKAGGRAAIFLALLLAGCRNRDLLEGELRQREELYREALDEQRKAEARADALQRELAAVRHGGPHLAPEAAAMSLGVKRITLGRATGGYDQDGLPGDEMLQVVVEPRDCDDHVIKAPGSLQVCALEITPQGLKVPISTWELSPEELRRTWKQGLLSTGYSLLLPWKHQPHTDMVRVVVRLIVADSRIYEADKDVRVHVLPGADTRPPAVSTDAVPMPGTTSRPPTVTTDPAPADSLPAPRVLPNDSSSEGPSLVPSTSKSEYHTSRRITPWTPATLQGTVRIGRPEPISEP